MFASSKESNELANNAEYNAETASSMEAVRATEQDEEHDLNAQDSKTMRVVQVQSLQTPPGHDPFPFPTCEYYAAPLRLHAFSPCVTWKFNLSIGGERLWRSLLDALFCPAM